MKGTSFSQTRAMDWMPPRITTAVSTVMTPPVIQGSMPRLSEARLEMEQLFGARVFLELFVRVRKEWTSSDQWLQEFGILKR